MKLEGEGEGEGGWVVRVINHTSIKRYDWNVSTEMHFIIGTSVLRDRDRAWLEVFFVIVIVIVIVIKNYIWFVIVIATKKHILFVIVIKNINHAVH
jgi:hypothetical protein